jgi:hypothetical protein
MAQLQMTTLLDEVRLWAEKHKARPAIDKNETDPEKQLRFILPDQDKSDDYDELNWEEFESKFNGQNLAFVYQLQDDGSMDQYYRLQAQDSFIDQQSASPEDAVYRDDTEA